MDFEYDLEEFLEEHDMALLVAFLGYVPHLEKGTLLTYEKDRQPENWLTRGRVRESDCRGWEVENLYSGHLEFVLPHEVLEVEEKA